jgi:uncharacterized alpha-E superfamily protein
VWYFYTLGKLIERADQTTRLLDINHHHLNTALAGASAPEVRHWHALLRSVAGLQAFRRMHQRGMQPLRVVDFLLFDRAFPRSVRAASTRIGEVVERLAALPELEAVTMPWSGLRPLQAHLTAADIDDVAAIGLHDYLDRIQSLLIAFTDDLRRTFFGHEAIDGNASQRQSQDGLPLPPAGALQRAPGDHPAAGQP